MNNFKWVNADVDPDAVANSFDPYGHFGTGGSGNITCHSAHITADGYLVTIYYGPHQENEDNIRAQKISIYKV